MPDTLALQRVLEGFETTPSVAMTPFTVEAADFARGEVRLLFEPRPDFANRNGVIQGGLAMGMMDVALSLAGFAGTGLFGPTVELKASYLAPLPIGPVLGVGRVLKAGRTLVFLEGSLSAPGSPVSIASTATTLMPRDG